MSIRRFFQAIALAWLAAGPVAAREAPVGLAELRELEGKVAAVVKRALPATVALVSESTGASGSGVITSRDGLILTAAHVTDGAETMVVIFPDGKQAEARVLGSNYSKDIGMARIEGEGEWPFVELGESKRLSAGDWVVAMGHSEGYDPARTPPVRFGRVVSEGPGNYLSSDCELIGGDSGGPLFDLEGRLVAINSSIGEALDNNNHAGIDGFREDWDRLLAGEAWGELRLNPLANPERAVIGIAMGRPRRDGAVPIAQVLPASPAARAGLRAGDVIVSVNGSRLDGGRGLQLRLAKFSGGDRVALGIERGRELFEVELEVIRADQLEERMEER